jgi:hypothetical protein
MVIQGKAYYAKVLGAPAWGYKKQYKEWSIDVTLDAATKARLLEAGMSKSAIKNKQDDRGEFLTFKRREKKKDGTDGKPIEVVNKKGQEWNQKALIGNGSVVNCKIALNEYEGETKPGLIKLQIVEHAEYEGRAGDDEDLPMYNDDGTVEDWSQ